MIRCTVGVMAYNEEETIVPVLRALLAQRTDQCVIEEIIVVASGCTDRTAERAAFLARNHPLIRVDVEPIRAGKAAAVNRLINLSKGEVVVLVGADTLPDPIALERLTAPFSDPTVGMTGARVVPLNSPRSFLGWSVHLLWHLHHRMALQSPKLGELVAFRNVVPTIPPETATDEVALEAALTAQGYRLVYVAEAMIYNYGPETVADFIQQRRRIFAGHLHIAQTLGYRPVSMRNAWLMRLGLKLMRRHPPLLPRLGFAALLEGYARLLGWYDHLSRHTHRVWRRVQSTKQVQREGRFVRLVAVNCRNRIPASELLRRAAQTPAELGTLVWWDTPLSEAVFALPDEPDKTPEQQLEPLIAHFGSRSRFMIAYRLIEFPVWHAPEQQSSMEGSPAWVSPS
jgi:biofilm PGA synthesis N-glycosyltransferase PgaC